VVANEKKQIAHLNHVVERFPNEKRFLLAEGLARESRQPTESVKVYQTLTSDLAVGGEAAVRLGSLLLRRGAVPNALELFAKAESMTREPSLIYLARFYRGQALVRNRQEDGAIAAFRGALAARPGAQSASAALAGILARRQQRTEAQAVMKAVLDAGPHNPDPHIEYVHGDDRFWPVLIAHLHAEIAR
jgi:tetratricopeptide (TPR) repeat protein